MSNKRQREAARARAAGQSPQAQPGPAPLHPQEVDDEVDAPDVEEDSVDEAAQEPVQRAPAEELTPEVIAGAAPPPERGAPPDTPLEVASDDARCADLDDPPPASAKPEAPAGPTLGGDLYGDLMASAIEEGEFGAYPAFHTLPPSAQRVWETFGRRMIARFGSVPAAGPARQDGLVRCRARNTIALLAATDEVGRPLPRVRAGVVCLVRPDVYERASKHLERL